MAKRTKGQKGSVPARPVPLVVVDERTSRAAKQLWTIAGAVVVVILGSTGVYAWFDDRFDAQERAMIDVQQKLEGVTADLERHENALKAVQEASQATNDKLTKLHSDLEHLTKWAQQERSDWVPYAGAGTEPTAEPLVSKPPSGAFLDAPGGKSPPVCIRRTSLAPISCEVAGNCSNEKYDRGFIEKMSKTHAGGGDVLLCDLKGMEPLPGELEVAASGTVDAEPVPF